MGFGPQESELIHMARQGDGEAFAMLCEAYRRHVWRTVASVAFGPDADDLAQEAILRALHSIRSYRGEAPFGAWLCRIALNVAHDHLRTGWKRRVTLFIRPPEREDSEAASPQAEAEKRDTTMRVRSEVALLPSPVRVAVWLHYFEEYTVAEIAALERTPESTIRSRLRTGLKRLCLAMSDLMDDHPPAPVRSCERQGCEV